jgi:hypothetical protein
MDITLLKQIKKGEQIDYGELFPGIDEGAAIDVQWTCTNVVDDCVRETPNGTHRFRVADFELRYCGVSLGSVRAIEQDDGMISWVAAT